MPAGPPCVAKKAAACAANPSRPSQYKLIPKEILDKYGLPDGACVCKSKLCWRVFDMADEPKKPGRPSAALKRPREDCSTPVFNASTASRSKPAVVVKIHSIKDARCRPPLRRAASYRCAQTVCGAETVGPGCHRCTTVDFERPTSDEAVVEARRDALPVARSSTLEYAVHGKFRMREGGASFPDMFWLSPRELVDGGCSVDDVVQAAQAYKEELAMAREEACAEAAPEEEESASEEECEDGAGDETREEAAVGEGGSGREQGVDAVAVAGGAGDGALLRAVPLVGRGAHEGVQVDDMCVAKMVIRDLYFNYSPTLESYFN